MALSVLFILTERTAMSVWFCYILRIESVSGKQEAPEHFLKEHRTKGLTKYKI